MMRFTKILAQLTAILIVSGLILHEVIPHHHHASTGEAHACCENHNHNSPERSSEQACIFLSNIHFENYKPALEVYSQFAKQGHFNGKNLHTNESIKFQTTLATASTPPYVPLSEFSESEYLRSFKLRGPPSA